MYVAVVPNRGSRPAILLRESYRDGDKVKNRTLKNLSDWPAERIQLLRAVLRGETLVPAGEGLAIVRALPHGHVSAALGTARRIELDRLLPRRPERRRKLALALIVARLTPRVRAHVFLCLLAYHLEWHLRQALAPMLFDDHDRAAAEAGRASALAKAQPSAAAKRKAASKLTDNDMPVHSFRSLLADLATLTRNTVRFGRDHTTEILATPTEIQRRAFDLLALEPAP